MIDVELVTSELPYEETQAYLLSALLGHEYIEVVKYSDAGPPEHAVRQANFWSFADGWVLARGGERDDEFHNITYAYSGKSAVHTARSEHLLDEVKKGDGPFGEIVDGEPVSKSVRLSDYRAGMTAEAVDADIYVTRRKYLRAVTHTYVRDIDVLQPEAALSVVSLYLRAQGVFRIHQNWTGGSHSFNRGLFYWVATRDLLPAAWRYFPMCLRVEVQYGEPSPPFLAQSALQRVDRVLRERDRIHISLNRPQNNDVADEITTALDALTFSLLGAFDSLARVAHLTLGLQSSIKLAGWQRRDWLRLVSESSPALGSIFADGKLGTNILYILVILRNSVHGEALQSLAVSNTGQREGTLVGLPGADIAELRTRMQAVGGLSSWGVHELIPGRMHVDAGIFVDKLFPLATATLNEIMVGTPVENLLADSAPPADGPDLERDTIFGVRQRYSIRAQLGLA